MKYRKKPVEVEAMQWLPGDPEAAGAVAGWLGANGVNFDHPDGRGETTTLAIPTLEGVMTAMPGDWVVKGTRGEFYPVKPQPFADTFEPAPEDA